MAHQTRSHTLGTGPRKLSLVHGVNNKSFCVCVRAIQKGKLSLAQGCESAKVERRT